MDNVRKKEERRKKQYEWEENLFLCGDVNVALTEVEEKVPVDHVSNTVCRCLAVNVRIGVQMHLDKEIQKQNEKHSLKHTVSK